MKKEKTSNLDKLGVAYSANFSFENFSKEYPDFVTFINYHKDTIKNIIVGVIGLSSFISMTYLPIWANAGLTTIITSGGKLVVELLDFYIFKKEILYLKD